MNDVKKHILTWQMWLENVDTRFYVLYQDTRFIGSSHLLFFDPVQFIFNFNSMEWNFNNSNKNWTEFEWKDRLRAPSLYGSGTLNQAFSACPQFPFNLFSIWFQFLFDFFSMSVRIPFNWIEIEWKLNRIEKNRWVHPMYYIKTLVDDLSYHSWHTSAITFGFLLLAAGV